jgi:hypothetical protein
VIRLTTSPRSGSFDWHSLIAYLESLRRTPSPPGRAIEDWLFAQHSIGITSAAFLFYEMCSKGDYEVEMTKDHTIYLEDVSIETFKAIVAWCNWKEGKGNGPELDWKRAEDDIKNWLNMMARRTPAGPSVTPFAIYGVGRSQTILRKAFWRSLAYPHDQPVRNFLAADDYVSKFSSALSAGNVGQLGTLVLGHPEIASFMEAAIIGLRKII